MFEVFKNPALIVYGQLVLATFINMITVFFLKKADGFTNFWPSVGVVVSVSLVQFLVSRAISSGMEVGLAMTTVLVFIMIGSIMMGVLIFGESISLLKMAGLLLAIIGVAMASLSKA